MTKERIKDSLQSLGKSPTEQCFKDFLHQIFAFRELNLAENDQLLSLAHNSALSSFDFKRSIIYFTTTDTESKLQKAQSGHTNLAFSLIPTTSHHKTDLVCATRAVNKAISSYNILFFLGIDSLSIAFATRRLSRATNEKVDVLEKITLIKDISLHTPHPAHIGNLHSLTLPTEHTLDKYYQSLLETLSIETLNKAFFESIKTHFLDFCEQCTLPTDTQNQEDSINKKREFILRLISRLLFCQFLEKKGLINPKLWDTTLTQNYYHEVCEPLFFNTLNTPKESRDYGLLESKITALLDAIPYLNGGLFAPREKEDFFDSTCPNAYINTLQIPNTCFEKLFKTFRSYHFTLSESTPLSQEVGLDPELLGMVFENLLSVLFTDNAHKDLRKATGSYYTPREIVSYMCASSLCESLKNRTNMTESKLEKLVFEKDALGFTDTEAKEILNCLDSLKILDPACGSGAFPLGMLHEILEIQDALRESSALGEQCDKIYNFSQGTDAKSANLAKNRKNLHSPTANLGSLDSNNVNPNLMYKRKLKILQNNIYGIDIQPMATEIARLRCFLSLICDAPNQDIKPLPNLEFKFISANSLIPLPKQEGLGYVGYEEDMLRLKALRDQTFDALNKQALESAYLTLRNKIAKNLSSAWQTHQVDFSKNPLLSWNPFDPHSVAEFFDSEWMFGIKVAAGGGQMTKSRKVGTLC